MHTQKYVTAPIGFTGSARSLKRRSRKQQHHIYLRVNRWRVQARFADFEFNRLLADDVGDVLLAARQRHDERCFGAGHVQVHCLGVVVVFACLPVIWPVSAAAFELFEARTKERFQSIFGRSREVDGNQSIYQASQANLRFFGKRRRSMFCFR